MRLSILRSGALRLAAIFAILFAAAAVVYVTAIHLAVGHYARTTLENAIEADIALLRGDPVAGRAGVSSRLERRPPTYSGLVDPKGSRIAGTFPPGNARVGWHVYEVASAHPADDDGDEPIEVLAKGVRLADGDLLVVGRSLHASGELVEWLDATALWSSLGVVVLALGGGWLIASVFLKRLDRVNAAIERIMAGAFGERLPAIGMGEEFDTLARRLNAMLDHIISLMEGHRHLSTNVAHDLRMPLTRVRHRLEAARDAPESRDVQAMQEALDATIGDLDAVLATFAALLRLATIETGALRARFRRIDLAALLGTVEGLYAPVAEDRGKTLSLSTAGRLEILGDAELITQLFANLVENALLHTGEGTRIELGLERRGDDAIASILDDGPGIPAEELSNVVKRHHRLHASTASPGAGLGLALADAIATLHGGRLVLSNARPGLRATVSCPLASDVA